jgi:hypothetical protein
MASIANADCATFVCHDFEALIEIAINTFDHHWIVIVPQKDVMVELQQITGFLKSAEEFCVLVKDDSMTQAKSELDFH